MIDIKPEPALGAGNGSSPVTYRDVTDRQLWLWAGVVGAIGGLLALAYYAVMRCGLDWVWGRTAHLDVAHLGLTPSFHPKVWVITTAGGFVVGWVLRLLGVPGEIAAVVDNIHLERGRLDPRQTPSMVAASLVSIVAGGSAGPEAPLVQIVGSFGSWVGDRLHLRPELVRTLTFCGMASALGAFFGAPLGGALFALEIPHRRGLEYYEALMPSILAAIVAFFVFRSAVGYEGPIYHFAAVPMMSISAMAIGLGSGVLGAGVGAAFIGLFRGMEHYLHPLSSHRVLLATLGGFLIGAAAQIAPITLFWGEHQIVSLLAGAPLLVQQHTLVQAIAVLLGVALLKMLTVGFTLHSGFRGGFIFPLFFIGAAVGLALATAASAWYPQLPVPIVVLCTMAATNVAVTKTPISTAVILSSLSGTDFIPALAAACFASFVLTSRVSLIGTQRSRLTPAHAGTHSPAAHASALPV